MKRVFWLLKGCCSRVVSLAAFSCIVAPGMTTSQQKCVLRSRVGQNKHGCHCAAWFSKGIRLRRTFYGGLYRFKSGCVKEKNRGRPRVSTEHVLRLVLSLRGLDGTAQIQRAVYLQISKSIRWGMCYDFYIWILRDYATFGHLSRLCSALLACGIPTPHAGWFLLLLLGCVNNRAYVSTLSTNANDLKHRIIKAITSLDRGMLIYIWQEFWYHIDPDLVAVGGNI